MWAHLGQTLLQRKPGVLGAHMTPRPFSRMRNSQPPRARAQLSPLTDHTLSMHACAHADTRVCTQSHLSCPDRPPSLLLWLESAPPPPPTSYMPPAVPSDPSGLPQCGEVWGVEGSRSQHSALSLRLPCRSLLPSRDALCPSLPKGSPEPAGRRAVPRGLPALPRGDVLPRRRQRAARG